MTPPHVVKEGGREGMDEMFDSIVRELQTSRFSHDKMTFPLRYLKLPSRPVSHSKRLRSRWRAKEILAKLANRIIDVLNSMYRYTRAPDFRAGVERATEGAFEARLLKLVKPLRGTAGNSDEFRPRGGQCRNSSKASSDTGPVRTGKCGCVTKM